MKQLSTQEKGVNLLSLKAPQPEKMALHLMDALFTDEKMGTCCFVASSRSKKPALSHEKVALMEGMTINRKSSLLASR